MPCCVPRCVPDSAGSVRKLVRFPMDVRLRKRWLKVIKLGTGVELVEPVRLLDQNDQPLQLCLGHLERPEELNRYQEPARFVDGSGTPRTLRSCRLCLQFVPAHETITPEDSVATGVQLGGLNLPSAIQRTFGIRIQRGDFLRTICLGCLAKVELVLAVRNQFRMNEYLFETVRTAGGERLEVVEEEEKGGGEDVKEFVDELEILDEEFADDRDDEDGDESVEAEPVEAVTYPPRKRKKGSGVVDHEKKRAGENDDVEDESVETVPVEPVKKEKKRLKRSGEKKTEGKKVEVKMTNKLSIKEVLATTCYICKKLPFASKDELDLHLTMEHIRKDSQYTCAVCNDGEKILMVQTYNQHLSHHDESIRRFKCRFCPMMFNVRKSLRLHENKKHGQNHTVLERNPERDPTCETCGKVLSNMANLERHKRTAHCVNEGFKCKLCDKSLTTRISLLQHMQTHSTKQQFYNCDLCDKKFKYISQLAGHKAKAHTALMNDYLCVLCQIRYVSMPEYEAHMREHHVDLESYEYSCRLCPTVPQTDQELKQHIAQAHADERYPYFKCVVCSKKLHTKMQLVQHRREGHSQSMCDRCGKSFASKESLKLHINGVHLGIKRPNGTFECPDCEFRCAHYPNLRRHQKVVHLGERPFHCSYCNRRFGAKTGLENHVRNIHTGEKKFGCRHCGMRFKESSTFSKHQKSCGERKGD